ncbi:hypothetical protein [Streptomyces sp. NPDC087300]|uniref:hypothetical protein n=1 Tax=Streptomyces sp. NPDC087300 TaxID=3365780 RepID=UPI0038086B93
MRDLFVDELLLITPLRDAVGVRLYGEALGAHKAPLAVAVTEHSSLAEEVTVDLTRVTYLSNSVLETLVALARSLTPPRCLRVLAGPELGLLDRLMSYGWDEIGGLRVMSG